ncbi:MAG: putative phosphoesterase [Saprospiraceae bacterium]|jgi:putative phosphoesterase
MDNKQHEYDFSDYSDLIIGVVSDTHGVISEDVVNHIKQCDIALHAGDIMGLAPLNKLQPKLGKVISVKGNNDILGIWPPESASTLEAIPDQASLKFNGGTVVIEHGHRVYHSDFALMHEALKRDHADARVVVYGHTHVRTIDGSSTTTVINPGAAGRTRVHDGPSCLTIIIKQGCWKITEHVFPFMTDQQSTGTSQ